VLARLAPALATAVEERFGAPVRGQGERVELCVRDKDVAELLRMVLEAGAEIVSVTPHRASLESVFLSAVHEGEREEQMEGAS
jgi:hypothetical protein